MLLFSVALPGTALASTYWDFTQDRPLNGLPPLPEQIYHPLFNPLPEWRTKTPNAGTLTRRPFINRRRNARRPYEAAEAQRPCPICKRIPVGY